MSAQKVSRDAVKANQQGTELVHPGERPLAAEAQLVDLRIEQAFASAFGLFAGALVFRHIGNELVVEARPAGGFGVKSGIGVEVTADKRNAEPLDELESSPWVVLQLEGIVVVARDDARGCQDETIGVRDGKTWEVLAFLRP